MLFGGVALLLVVLAITVLTGAGKTDNPAALGIGMLCFALALPPIAILASFISTVRIQDGRDGEPYLRITTCFLGLPLKSKTYRLSDFKSLWVFPYKRRIVRGIWITVREVWLGYQQKFDRSTDLRIANSPFLGGVDEFCKVLSKLTRIRTRFR
jgi:hypothetical protein